MIDELERLREDVRATAPEPREAFVAQLEERVEAGFPKPKRARSPRRERVSLRAPIAALAVSLLFLVVVGSAVIGGSGGDEPMDASSGGGTAEQAEPVRPAPSEAQGGGSAAEAAPTPDDSTFLQARPRRADSPRLVERRTALELAAGRDEFDEVTAGVLRVADDTGSVVQRSNVRERDGKGLATYDLRVPAARLDDALAALSRLGKVTSRSAASQDITQPYVSARARLDDARDERQALLKALQNADTTAEADALRRRIRLARGRIATAERDVAALKRRGDLARVDVTVEGTGKLSEEGATWTPGDALDDAGRILEVALGVVVVSLAAALPFLLILALAVAAGRVVRRRRREGALDPI